MHMAFVPGTRDPLLVPFGGDCRGDVECGAALGGGLAPGASMIHSRLPVLVSVVVASLSSAHPKCGRLARTGFGRQKGA